MAGETLVIGCDVSKTWIDVCELRPEGAIRARMENEPSVLQLWARSLPVQCRVGMEATGTMHESLAASLVRAGHTVYVINPRWIHSYSRSLGQRGKSDRGDAAVIARYVQAEWSGLHAYTVPGPEQSELRRLLLRRLELVKLRTATRQSLGPEGDALLKQFDVFIRDVEKRIRRMIREAEPWRDLYERVRQLPGVGPIVAAHLVQVLTRIPFNRSDAFIAHTGTDPRANDSGQKRGRRRLSHHGDAALRHVLFMAAMAAIKRPEWRKLYESYRNRGLPSTGALIAVARKIARVAWHVFRTGENYDPTKVCTLSAS